MRNLFSRTAISVTLTKSMNYPEHSRLLQSYHFVKFVFGKNIYKSRHSSLDIAIFIGIYNIVSILSFFADRHNFADGKNKPVS